MRRRALLLLLPALLVPASCAKKGSPRLGRALALPRPPARPLAREPGPNERSLPSIGALSSRVYVRSAPRPDSPEIGILHFGSVVRLRQSGPNGKQGCAGGWYAVEPEGWVCRDESTTLEAESHPLLRAKRAHRGRFEGALPFRWSASREGLLYRRLPSAHEQERTEYELARHLAQVSRLRTDDEARVPRTLVGVDVREARGSAPDFLLGGDAPALARRIPGRSTIAWTDEFTHEGRSWVLTDDLLVAPKDKLLPEEPSDFAGVQLSETGVRLPIAFVRVEPRPKFRLVKTAVDVVPVAFGSESVEPEASSSEDSADPLGGFSLDTSVGEIEPTGESWPRLSFVVLTGRIRKQGRTRFVETSEQTWMRERDATLVDARPPRGFELRGDEKWIDVSIFRGTLVAYEGSRPVFATLISPGINGYRRVDGEPAKHTTPTGTFRIEWKHRTTTMTPDPERMSYYLSEVPHTQFFHMPFALHAAYWHDRFGEPKSGGCVNLSPRDAKWLFDWTEPHVPEGWHAVRSGDARGPGTWVRIH